jgi:hypothetical protein
MDFPDKMHWKVHPSSTDVKKTYDVLGRPEKYVDKKQA